MQNKEKRSCSHSNTIRIGYPKNPLKLVWQWLTGTLTIRTVCLDCDQKINSNKTKSFIRLKKIGKKANIEIVHKEGLSITMKDVDGRVKINTGDKKD